MQMVAHVYPPIAAFEQRLDESLCLPYAALICFAHKRNLTCTAATKRHDGQISQNLSSPFRKNIPLNVSGANQLHNSARLTADEGRWPSSRTCGEMRWTRELRLTCVAQAYGEVVWS